jgi:hypothetical protein
LSDKNFAVPAVAKNSLSQRRGRDIFVETQTKNFPAPSGRHLLFENSPALQRWVNRSNKPSKSHQGRKNFLPSLTGLFISGHVQPSLERPGYFRKIPLSFRQRLPHSKTLRPALPSFGGFCMIRAMAACCVE